MAAIQSNENIFDWRLIGQSEDFRHRDTNIVFTVVGSDEITPESVYRPMAGEVEERYICRFFKQF